MIRYVFIFVCLMGAAWAEEPWIELDNQGIQEALGGKSLRYETATQKFYADGRTAYHDQNGPSWGKWQPRGDKYCSLWPPSGAWTCYDVELNGETQVIRFVDASGGVIDGTYIDDH